MTSPSASTLDFSLDAVLTLADPSAGCVREHSTTPSLLATQSTLNDLLCQQLVAACALAEVSARDSGVARLMGLACELELLGGSYSASGLLVDDSQPVWTRVLSEYKRHAGNETQQLELAAKGRAKGQKQPPRVAGEYLMPQFDREQQSLASQSLAVLNQVCAVVLDRSRDC
jgi:hypothetical protein